MSDDAQNVMLAEKWDESVDPTGWWVSEKLDGVRAYWSGTCFYSRLGNKYNAPAWFTQGLPTEPLDGELWCGHRQFRKCVSIVKRNVPTDDWKHITYFVFDAPKLALPFEDRMAYIASTITPTLTPHASAVGMRKCLGASQLKAELRIVEDKGGEGLMLRRPQSPYVRGRCRDLLKVKSFLDEEAIVVSHVAGQGRNSHRMGALLCRTPDGREFSVGSGFTDSERNKPPKIGSVITYRFQELTDKNNVPRFPIFVGQRPDIDWSDYCKQYRPSFQPAPPALKTNHSLLYNTYGGAAHPFSTATSSAAAAAKRPRGGTDSSSGADRDGSSDSDDDARPMCKYGRDCYRTNAEHVRDFRHPAAKRARPPSPDVQGGSGTDEDELSDTVADVVDLTVSSSSSTVSVASAARTPCRYGKQCFRTNAAHLLQYSHD